MIDIKSEDLSISSWSSKPVSPWVGAQMNGIRIVHKPTGIEVMCDIYKSQHGNRALCMEQLRIKLKGREGVVTHNEHIKEKAIAVDFFHWWHNQPGTNTEQGFDDWWAANGQRFNEDKPTDRSCVQDKGIEERELASKLLDFSNEKPKFKEIDILIANLMAASRAAGFYRGVGHDDGGSVDQLEDEALEELQASLKRIAK